MTCCPFSEDRLDRAVVVTVEVDGFGAPEVLGRCGIGVKWRTGHVRARILSGSGVRSKVRLRDSDPAKRN